MKMGKLLAYGLTVLFCLYVLAPIAAAQYRATIQGTVTDAQGSVVSEATVTLTNQETNLSQTTTTNENGYYSFNALPPSRYTVSVERTGFKKKTLNDVGLVAEQVNGVNIQLEVGEVTQTVTVSGDQVPLLDTETASNSGTVTQDNYQRLPSFGRDPFQLLQLAPGAFGDGSQSAGGGTNNLPGTTIGGTSATDGIFKTENGGQITANGARTGENNYTIDGVGMTSVSWGGTAVITPNIDSVKEVKVITDNYDAEYGRYRGAQVQIISQNGTNSYHGSLFLRARRPGLNAFQPYNGYNNSVVRDNARFNDYGATIGGPILKNKLFVFFSYETLKNKQVSSDAGGFYETPGFRALAASGTNAAAILGFPGTAPAGGTVADVPCSDIGLVEGPFCHEIPGQGLDLGSPLSSALGTHDPSYVSPTQPGFGSGLDGAADIQLLQNIPNPSNADQAQYNGRVDFTPTTKDLIAFSIYYVPTSKTSFNGSGVRGANLFNHEVLNEAFTALWDHTFSPTIVNEVRVNAAGWRWKDLPLNPNAPWGLPPINFSNGFNSNAVIGSATLQGFGIGAPGTFDQWTYGLKDVLTKVHGSHNLKMGGEVTRLLFVDNSPWNARPTYSFLNYWDFLNDAPVAEQASFDPRTGIPTDFRKDTRSNLYGFFIQDSWKVRSNLTVTIGLRYEYFGAISEKNGHLATSVLGQGANNLFTDARVRLGDTLYDSSTNNFGPQLGFAWSPHRFMGHEFGNRFVIRGGFGIAYNPLDEAISLSGRSNPPFLSASGVLTGDKILYENSFPADVNSFGGYASNPAAIATFDPNTNLPVPNTANFALVGLTGYSASWPTTTTYHYTLQGEYELGHNWIASLGYQGSSTRHLTQQYNLYDIGAAEGLALNPVVQGLNYYANDGSAHFNAMLAELHHKFGSNFELDTQYRLSRSIDSGSNNFANPNYQYNIQSNIGPSDYDVTHAVKVWGIWTPTLFRGSHSWAEKIFGGWSLSGIMNWHSGFPYNPVYNTPFDPVFGGSSGFGGSGQLRPAAFLGGATDDFSNDAFKRADANFPGGGSTHFTAPTVVKGPSFECVTTDVPTINCPTGRVPFGPLPTAPGVERNAFRGPRYFDIDATLSKAFGLPKLPVLGENARLEFRANFYNLFNNENLWNINKIIGNINADGSVSPNDRFGQAQNGLGGRVIEMQARFSF
jgi:hypothetical protein